MVGVGTGALVSVTLGKGDMLKVQSIMAHFLLIGCFIGIVIPLIMLPSLEWILVNLLRCSESALPAALEYARVIFLYTPLGYYCLNGTGSILRVENRAGVSMARQVMGAVLNMAFDPVFMGWLGIGIAGAAYSSSISMLLVGVAMLVYFYHPATLTVLRPDIK
ncbi:multi antimicrobial extrusion protein, partial [Kipferlia bialata]|eukprot:g11258.t1